MTMKQNIQFKSDKEEVYISEKCYIIELSNNCSDPDVSIAQARVEPGITTQWHRLKNITERYCIISGTGLVEVGDLAPQTVCAGDVVTIPAMCRQRISNIGSQQLIFLAICTPTFVSEEYENIQTDV